MLDEGLGYRFGRGVRNGDCFGPPGEAVYACHDVRACVGRWKRPDNVNMDLMEAARRRGEGLKWRYGVAVYLYPLARNAGTRPSADIGVHVRPDVVRCQQALGAADTRVREAMEEVKCRTAKGWR